MDPKQRMVIIVGPPEAQFKVLYLPTSEIKDLMLATAIFVSVCLLTVVQFHLVGLLKQ